MSEPSIHSVIEPWARPLGGDAKTGADPRGLPAYQALRDEIAKLESPGAGPCRWEVVEREASAVLAESRDLASASYLAGALAQRRGIEGLALGATLLATLLERFESPYPVRPRARASALGWYLERAEHIAGNVSVRPADRAHLAQLEDALDALRRAAIDRLGDDAPSTHRLAEAVQRLVLALPPEPAPAPAPAEAPASPDAVAPSPTAAAVPAPSLPPTAPPTGPAAAAPSTAVPVASPAPVVAAPAVAASAAAAPIPSPPAPSAPAAPPTATLPPLSLPEPPEDLQRLPQHLVQLGTALLSTARVVRAAAPLDANGLRLVLAALYLPVTQAPAISKGRRTGMPAPAAGVRLEVERTASESDPARAVEVCLRALEKHRFWLDAHLALHHALARAPAAREALDLHASEVRTLALRLPQLVELEFSDGTPFATESARAWLASLSSSSAPSGSGDGSTPLDDALRDAREALRAGRATDALARAHDATRLATTARDRFAARLEVGALALDAKAPTVALALAAELHREATARDLADWDAPLAARACALYLRAAKATVDAASAAGGAAKATVDVALPFPTAEVHARLCLLDPATAAQLARS